MTITHTLYDYYLTKNLPLQIQYINGPIEFIAYYLVDGLKNRIRNIKWSNLL